MINKILNKILNKVNNSGGQGAKFWGFVYKIAFYVFYLIIPIALATLLVVQINKIAEPTGFMVLLMCLVYLFVSIGPIFLESIGFGIGKKSDKASDKSKKRRLPVDTVAYTELPHFGNLFGNTQTKELLEKEIFHRYTYKSGKEAHSLRISESGKWISFMGGFLPLDLIIGYNRKKAELYTLDGYTVKLPLRAHSFIAKRELERFFKERGNYYKNIPQNTRTRYYDVRRDITPALSKADWGKVRYSWEKAMANDTAKTGKDSYSDESIGIEIFERVLSDKEINKLLRAIKSKETDLSGYLDFDMYKTDQSVCNAIELLKLLRYPQNLEGCDFLLDCLRDVDEPCFFMAADLLKTYPHKLLEEKIEEYAAKAHENGDVEKFGGLLYLAKELDYEIKYVEKMKEISNK